MRGLQNHEVELGLDSSICSEDIYYSAPPPMPGTEPGKGGQRVPTIDNSLMNRRISDCAKCQEGN